jgi:hypothetical protein
MKEETLQELLDLTVKLSGKLEVVSVQIIEKIEEEQFDSLTSLTDNRDRLIKLINGLLETMNCFDQLKEHEVCYKAIQKAIHNSITFDEKIIKLLENNKSQLKAQISQLFKSKEKFKGYNLKNVGA